MFDGFELQCGVMKDYFLVEHLSLERLLKEWRWLCPQTVVLIARNAFGDLYLRDEFGKILKLDVAIGQIKEVAESETEFRRLAATKEKREEWFAESDELAASRQELKPDANQCIGFKTPLVFAESGTPAKMGIGAGGSFGILIDKIFWRVGTAGRGFAGRNGERAINVRSIPGVG